MMITLNDCEVNIKNININVTTGMNASIYQGKPELKKED
jgi:hypothetical protein